MPELRANNEKPNFDNNPKLIEAIAAMRKEFKAETQNKVINAALRCTYLVPATVEQSTELVADEENHVDFQNKSKAKFILINNNKTKGTYFPAFTSKEEAEKLQADRKFQLFAMKFGDIATLTEQTKTVEGFVINPFHENLPFTQEMIASIKATLIKAKQEREAASGKGITHTTNENVEG
jgi:carboxylesterase type B